MPSRRNTALAAVLAVALAVPAASATAAAPAACANGTMARIAGKRTCLAPGRSCARRYQKQYKAKGYACRRKSGGAYRLVKVKQQF